MYRAQEPTADAPATVRRVDGDLFEVPVTLEIQHVGEADHPALVLGGHEEEARLGGPLLPRGGRRPVEGAEPFGEEPVAGILDGREVGKVPRLREPDGRHGHESPPRAEAVCGRE